jgi:hypothetical protein
VKNAHGVYEFACIEGTRPWFCDIIPAGEPLAPKFAAATTNIFSRFRSVCGNFDLVFAVRGEFPSWYLPEASDEQRKHSIAFWAQEYMKAP